ncbi:MAG TPA: hypothetical protein VLE69_02920 [Candidatus Saccharimonadales bacterium]|nr:hypothetical protein [Candidatus Saccharimonadales bacterium]
MVKPHSFLRKKPVIITILVIVVLIVGIVFFRVVHNKKPQVSVIPTTSNNGTTQQDQNTNTPTSTTGDKTPSTTPAKDQGSTPSSGAGPVQPYGTFISNHHPSLSGSGAPSSMQSVCLGTPGATCVITFTKDNQTKTLPTQTIAGDGSTTWNWDVNTAGLTPGSWKIKAVSTLNGKTAEATDSLDLVVSP